MGEDILVNSKQKGVVIGDVVGGRRIKREISRDLEVNPVTEDSVVRLCAYRRAACGPR